MSFSQDKFKVVTTFTVIADMAKNVAGESAEVVSITKPGAEIHGYQPTPQDIVKAQNADLILWNGFNLEVWFEQFFENLSDVPSFTLTKGIKPVNIVEGEYKDKPNPHAWMGLRDALIYVDNIQSALSIHDPSNSLVYSRNASLYKQKILETIRPLKEKIKSIPKEKRWLTTCEGAFSYLARDFEMHELYLWPINADAEGTPQQIRKVIDTVRKNQIDAIFCESTVSQKAAQQVARETDIKYGGVLYVDSLTDSNGKVPTYLDLIRVTSETIIGALSGS
ncbi:MAG: metal ABC transporter substrate-binding protein [Pseudomonadota bacterium]|nr:metal ABC transporter substrate-binding protein [Pseudomonadota bacterium]